MLAVLCLAVGVVVGQTCNLRGCQSGGLTTVSHLNSTLCTDITNHTACDNTWNLCPRPPTEKCHALLYGGLYGAGPAAGQNDAPIPYDTIYQWNQTYQLPGGPFVNPVSLTVSFTATIDSGYKNPNPEPYVLSLVVATNLFATVPLVGLLRNPQWLPGPGPKPADMNYRQFTANIPLPAGGVTLPSNIVVSYKLLTPGWITFNNSWVTVQTCAPASCVCFADPQNGYWAGPGCTVCAPGYAGANCDANVGTPPTLAPVPGKEEDEEEHTGGLKAAVALLTIATAALIGATFWFWRKTRSGDVLKGRIVSSSGNFR